MPSGKPPFINVENPTTRSERAMVRVDRWWFRYRNPSHLDSYWGVIFGLLWRCVLLSLAAALIIRGYSIVSEINAYYQQGVWLEDKSAFFDQTFRPSAGVRPISWLGLFWRIPEKMLNLWPLTLGLWFVLALIYSVRRALPAWLDRRLAANIARERMLEERAVALQKAADDVRRQAAESARAAERAAAEGAHARAMADHQKKVEHRAQVAAALQQRAHDLVRVEQKVLQDLQLRQLNAFGSDEPEEKPYADTRRILEQQSRSAPLPAIYGLLRISDDFQVRRIIGTGAFLPAEPPKPTLPPDPGSAPTLPGKHSPSFLGR